MTFRAYLDTIRARTGKGPEEFVALAMQRNLVGPQARASDVVAWLAEDFGLGRGHAMAIRAILQQQVAPPRDTEDRVAAVFAGPRQHFRTVFDELVAAVQAADADVALDPTNTYVSLTRTGGSSPSSERPEPASTWA